MFKVFCLTAPLSKDFCINCIFEYSSMDEVNQAIKTNSFIYRSVQDTIALCGPDGDELNPDTWVTLNAGVNKKAHSGERFIYQDL
jgi:hypothetical protein